MPFDKRETSIATVEQRAARKKAARTAELLAVTGNEHLAGRRSDLTEVDVYALVWLAELLDHATVYSACPKVAEAVWYGAAADVVAGHAYRLEQLCREWHPGHIVALTGGELRRYITEHTIEGAAA